MNEEEIRPAVKQVLMVDVGAYVLILVLLLTLLSLLPLPPSIFSAVAFLVLIVDTLILALRASDACWIFLTQRYTIAEGFVRIQRGRASKTSSIVPFRNIAEVRAVMPLLLRILGIGLVVIDTNDGSNHVLHNVKDPKGIAEKIWPLPAWEPVTRPLVG